eukprot:gene12677-biopygen8601
MLWSHGERGPRRAALSRHPAATSATSGSVGCLRATATDCLLPACCARAPPGQWVALPRRRGVRGPHSARCAERPLRPAPPDISAMKRAARGCEESSRAKGQWIKQCGGEATKQQIDEAVEPRRACGLFHRCYEAEPAGAAASARALTSLPNAPCVAVDSAALFAHVVP